MELEHEIRNIIEKECEDYFLGTTDLSVASDPIIDKYGALITEYPRAISFGITLPSMSTDKSFINHSKNYDRTNCKLRSISTHLSHMLEDKGYNAFPVPKSKVVDLTFTSLHNLAANMANMGKVEKNGLIVTPEVALGVNWGTVLTNALF